MPPGLTLDGEARLGTSESDRLGGRSSMQDLSLSARASQPRPSRAASPALQLAVAMHLFAFLFLANYHDQWIGSLRPATSRKEVEDPFRDRGDRPLLPRWGRRWKALISLWGPIPGPLICRWEHTSTASCLPTRRVRERESEAWPDEEIRAPISEPFPCSSMSHCILASMWGKQNM